MTLEFTSLTELSGLQARNGRIAISEPFTGNRLSVKLNISPNLDRVNAVIGVLSQHLGSHRCDYPIRASQSVLSLHLPQSDYLSFFPISTLYDEYGLSLAYTSVDTSMSPPSLVILPENIALLPEKVSDLEALTTVHESRLDGIDVALTELVAPPSSIDWDAVTGKPTSFNPAPHSHSFGDITDLSATLGTQDLLLIDISERVDALESSPSGMTVKTVTVESFAQNATEILTDVTMGILGIYEYIPFTARLSPDNLSSNTSDSGFIVAQSSAYSTNNNGFRLFDGQVTGEPDYCSNGNVPQWISVDFGIASELFSYEIFPSNVSITNDNTPKAWQLQGSSDGSTWTTLDTQSNITGWVSNTAKSFSLSTPMTYRYYRLNVTQTNGGSLVRIGEMRLYAPTGANYVKSDGNYAVSFGNSFASQTIKRIASGTVKAVIKYL